MNNFRIILYQTREQQVYRPSETISGAVEFTLTKPKNYYGIKVNFSGSAHVEWQSGKTRYVGEEMYIDNSLLLWSPQHSSIGSIGPGSFSFRFQFIIPPNVPSSFRNGRAYISYNLEARAVTGAFRFDHKASAPTSIFSGFTQQVSLFIRDHENVSKEIVAEITSEPIQPRSSYLWNPTNWILPPLTPTLLFSRIIHADYILEVSAVIPNAINLNCDISLLMGNLRFESSGPNLEDALLGAIVMAMVQGRSSARAPSEREAQSHDHGDVNGEGCGDKYNSSERDTVTLI